MPTDWDRVLHPRSVALVGASGREGHPMARPLAWLRDRGFAGVVAPVNPKYPSLGGLPCHPSLADVPGPVDLVLALVPAARAVDTVEEAGAVGAAAVVVFASGFAEVGEEGAALQAELAAVARRTGVRVLGPNCQGLYVARSRLFATFTAAGERPLEGSSGIAYVGQSGAIGGAVLDVAASRGLDLTAWVSTGNQADVDVTEIGRVLVADPDVRVLAVYTEALPSPEDYVRLAAEARDAGTALVVLRSGRTDAGRRAALSHTGAMLADGTAFELVSRAYGVVTVDDVEELLAAATLLRTQAPPRGRNVAAVTSSGGAGILAADRCADLGLAVPELGEETREKLALRVPAFGAVGNPVDVTAQLFNDGGGAFGEVCALVRADPAVDAVLILLTMLVGDTATALAADLADTVVEGPPGGPPLAVVWMAGEDATVEARAVLRVAGIPVFSSVAVATRVLASVTPRPAPPAVVVEPAVAPPGDGWDLLDAFGIPVPRSAAVVDPDEASGAVTAVGGTAVLKAVAAGLEHKTEAGGVRLGVTADTATGQAADLLAGVADTVLVQEQVAPGVELLVAVDGGRDGWPPVLTVGHGGTGTEIHRDVAHALAPVSPTTARELLASLRCWPLLAGHRGAAPADVDAAVDVIVRVGRAAVVPGLRELEVNPVVVGTSGAVAVDVLLDREDAATPSPEEER
ncbi:acetate--CoA ligase family protein [Actinomycetospora endophytica]|uniref:Acetate--CoA ligase family protein n=1 Tax=Actinomycetospora endophytica TaxID=2291215 RepID=A0ABS8P8S3_9PSEU|nr:acetate--CoA ligase family protein [Actinomycetospora endophytica]MCD2194643.1 acetate--CoA ligase family protein [Actinomycetospora endophytica]